LLSKKYGTRIPTMAGPLTENKASRTTNDGLPPGYHLDPHGILIPTTLLERGQRLAPFLDVIGRPDLKEILTPKTPWAYWTMELYGSDIKGQGGLGILAEDTRREAVKTGLPMVVVTPFYTHEQHQAIIDGRQAIFQIPIVEPQDKHFKEAGHVALRTRELVDGQFQDCPPTDLDVYTQTEGSVTTIAISEPELGILYQGETNGDHRLYQEAVLGFGGYKAVKELGLNPSINQLNEAPTVFAALARLDDEFKATGDLGKALEKVRANTIYTNHTLVQAVELPFKLSQFERFIMPNVSEVVAEWIRGLFKIEEPKQEPTAKLSTITLELAGKINGVSRKHAREASKTYRRANGEPVKFEPKTNGIAIDRWGDPALLKQSRESRVLGAYDLPAEDFADKIQTIPAESSKAIKDAARRRLIRYLRGRFDQFGNPIHIPEGARIAVLANRIAAYKRPKLLFEDPVKLALILKTGDTHLVIAGKAHPKDEGMQRALVEMFAKIQSDNNMPEDLKGELKKRIHYVQDYDEPLAREFAQGADMAIHTPTVHNGTVPTSTEACKTSQWKQILNNVVEVAVPDGGFADPEEEAMGKGEINNYSPSYLQISGNNEQEEIDSLYEQLARGIAMIRGDVGEWDEFTKRQLTTFLPIICGARMIKDYIDFAFPRKNGYHAGLVI
jgi:alpha-glucan phosphorylase-like protein